MATPDGRGCRGKRKVSKNTVNLSRKGPRLDRGRRGLLECNLNSDLWATLPRCLVEEILAKLPLSSLVRSGSVSLAKRWRDLIFHSNISPRYTSHHRHLCLFSSEELATYNSSRGTWETVPLQYLQLHFKLLDLVSSAGGLLCFSTMVVGEYIICNPLTKSFKRLQMPCRESNAESISEQPYMPTHSDAPGHLAGHLELVDVIRACLVGMVLNSDTGHFKFIVAGLMPWSKATTLVYDSHTKLWKKVGNICIPVDAPRNDLPSSTKSTRMVCGENFYAYFWGNPSTRNIFCKYDVEQEEWIQIRVPPDGLVGQRTFEITEFNGKILLVSKMLERGKMRLWAFELQETGPNQDTGPNVWPWLETNSLPFSQVNEALYKMKYSKCLGQGDVMFIVSGEGCHKFPGSEGTVDDCKASRHSMSISVKEFFPNVATNSYSNLTSKYWEVFEGDVNFPDLQIFSPSMIGFK